MLSTMRASRRRCSRLCTLLLLAVVCAFAVLPTTRAEQCDGEQCAVGDGAAAAAAAAAAAPVAATCGAPDAEVPVFRAMRLRHLPVTLGCTTYAQLLDAARTAFDEPALARVANRTGDAHALDALVAPLPRIDLATPRTSLPGSPSFRPFYVVTLALVGASDDVDDNGAPVSPASGWTRAAAARYQRWFFPALEVGERVPVSTSRVAGVDASAYSAAFAEPVDVDEAAACDARSDAEPAHPAHVELETLSLTPRVFRVHRLLSAAHVDEIVAHASNLPPSVGLGWEVSGVGVTPQTTKRVALSPLPRVESNEALRDSYRFSDTLWLDAGHRNTCDAARALRERGRRFLRASPDVSEGLQLVRYGAHGHYYFHWDAAPPSEHANNPYHRQGGNRYATLLVYLRTPPRGGDTVFPFADGGRTPRAAARRLAREVEHPEWCDRTKRPHALHAKVPPGDALLFYSLREETQQRGDVDVMSLHGGCPVDPSDDDSDGVAGDGDDDDGSVDEKWIVNLWVRNKRTRCDSPRAGKQGWCLNTGVF